MKKVTVYQVQTSCNDDVFLTIAINDVAELQSKIEKANVLFHGVSVGLGSVFECAIGLDSSQAYLGDVEGLGLVLTDSLTDAVKAGIEMSTDLYDTSEFCTRDYWEGSQDVWIKRNELFVKLTDAFGETYEVVVASKIFENANSIADGLTQEQFDKLLAFVDDGDVTKQKTEVYDFLYSVKH